MIRAAMTACVMLATVATAYADTRVCRPLESFIDFVASQGGTYEVHRDAQTLDKALNFYASTPPIGPAPKADGFLWVKSEGVPVLFIFTDGTNVCEILRFNSHENAELAEIMIFGRAS